MMNKTGQIEFSSELLFAAILGLVAGFISLIVIKSVPLGIVWKIASFVVTTIVATIVCYFIFNKE